MRLADRKLIRSNSLVSKLALALKEKVNSNLTPNARLTNKISEGLKELLIKKDRKGIEPSKVDREATEIVK